MGFRQIGIYWNSGKVDGLEIARELIDILTDHHIKTVTGKPLANALGMPSLAAGNYEDCDLLIVLGGDGTILSALDHALPKQIPILGINLGRLGFLSEIEPSKLREDMIAVLNGDYSIESRMTMTIEGQDNEQFFALNDIVITRVMPALRVLSLEVEVNGMPVDRYAGDGLIVASATGSTAYSLSAGGPVIRPGLNCSVITPICSHTLNARPVVVSSNDRITVRVMPSNGAAQAVLDGRKSVELLPGKKGITITKSNLEAHFIRLHERNYFSLLRNKLSEWTH